MRAYIRTKRFLAVFLVVAMVMGGSALLFASDLRPGSTTEKELRPHITTSFFDISADISADDMFSNQKTFCTKTLADDFFDDTVLVVLTREKSWGQESFAPEDFPEIDCAKVINLSHGVRKKIERQQTALAQLADKGITREGLKRTSRDSAAWKKLKKNVPHDLLDCEGNGLWLIEPEKYRVNLSLKLQNPGKENVLAAIRALEKRDDVLSAQPNEPFRIDFPEQDPLSTDTYCKPGRSTRPGNPPTTPPGNPPTTPPSDPPTTPPSDPPTPPPSDPPTTPPGDPPTTPPSDPPTPDNPSTPDVPSRPDDSFIPNDPELSKQWAIDKINLKEAWAIKAPRTKITIGVIDSGVDANHPDLAGQVDRTLGTSFVNDGASHLTDPNGHGTHVSGIIGAVGNNGIGVAGTNWSVNIVSIRVFNSSGSGSSESIASAINYAGANNIPIISFSGGGTGDANVIRNAVNQYPGLMVFAAGNNGWDNTEYPVYPASYNNPRIIAVASSGTGDTLSYFSCYSSTLVHLAAPGENILSTFPGNSYGNASGTSMATPYVSGVATLIMALEDTDYINDPLRVKNLILRNVDPVSSLNGKVSSAGRLNAYKALSAAVDGK
ncbi:MAG: S8 family serine peptidase [Peptococcaceae bacterium]|nr:S8 family serine peptidase [Peptococcaceae bacterium]